MFKYALELLEQIKFEHDKSIKKLEDSLIDIEEVLKERNVETNLSHLSNHADWLDDETVAFYRKKILDHAGNIRREIESD